MGYYVPNKVKPVCYNCPYRTNKYCGLLMEHDYLGDYPFNFEPYPYCPLIEVADCKTEPQTDNGIGCSRCEGRYDCYDRDMPHAVHCNNYGKITDEPQTEEWYNWRDEQEYNDRWGE